jgi:hypothetical protein
LFLGEVLDSTFLEDEIVQKVSFHAGEHDLFTIRDLPDDLLFLEIEHKEVLLDAEEAFRFRLNALSFAVAQIVVEQGRVLQGHNILVSTEFNELVRQVLEPDDHEHFLFVKHSDVVEALGVVSDAEFLVCGQRGHAQGRILQSGVAHKSAACAPEADTTKVVRLQLFIFLALDREISSSKMDGLNIFEHIAGVLTIFSIMRVVCATVAV